VSDDTLVSGALGKQINSLQELQAMLAGKSRSEWLLECDVHGVNRQV